MFSEEECLYTAQNECFLGYTGISPSVRPCVRLCVRLCTKYYLLSCAGGGIQSHLVTALVKHFVLWRNAGIKLFLF